MINMPLNEVVSATELCTTGEVTGILAAYWTKRSPTEVKFDMVRTVENNVVKCKSFVERQNLMQEVSSA